MSNNQKIRNDNLIGGLTLIGAGIGWLWGAFFPGLLIGLGTGLIISAIRSKGEQSDTFPFTDGKKEPQSASNSNSEPLENRGEFLSSKEQNRAVSEPPQAKDIEVVWSRILAHQGQVFHQVKGQAFTYQVSGNALIPSTTKAKIYKSQFAKALEHAPFNKVSDIPPDVFGPSYVYAILMDPRIRQNDW